MLTLRHVEKDGHEGIMQAGEVSFYPGKPTDDNVPETLPCLVAFGVPGPDAGARVNGVVQFGNGTVYVMNDSAKTIAIYNL